MKPYSCASVRRRALIWSVSLRPSRSLIRPSRPRPSSILTSSMASAAEIGSSTGSVGLAASSWAEVGSGGLRPMRQASAPVASEMAPKKMRGMPGTSPMTPEAADTTPSATGLRASCSTIALSAEPSTPAFDTRKPAAIEMIRAGIWVTRPSPIVSKI